MNTQLVESIIQVILSFSKEERHLLEEKLFFESSSPSTSIPSLVRVLESLA